MPLEQVGSSVVVVAHQFNPSVVSEVWLDRHGLLREEDKQEGCIFTDAIVNVRSRNYNLLVTPDQLQFSPKGAPEAHQPLIIANVGAIIELLPHIPYSGVGLNFIWHFDPRPESVAVASRRLFFRAEVPIFRHFQSEDSQFGSYLSKDLFGGRLKLDIKPVIRTAIQPSEARLTPGINFAFNFHRDLKPEENQAELIRGMLARWNEASEVAELIAKEAETLQ